MKRLCVGIPDISFSVPSPRLWEKYQCTEIWKYLLWRHSAAILVHLTTLVLFPLEHLFPPLKITLFCPFSAWAVFPSRYTLSLAKLAHPHYHMLLDHLFLLSPNILKPPSILYSLALILICSISSLVFISLYWLHWRVCSRKRQWLSLLQTLNH